MQGAGYLAIWSDLTPQDETDWAHWITREHAAERVGVLVGSGIGGIQTIVDAAVVLHTRGPDRVSPFVVPMMLPDMLAGLIANRVSTSRVVTIALMFLSMAATFRYGWWRVNSLVDYFSDESNRHLGLDASAVGQNPARFLGEIVERAPGEIEQA